MRLRVLVIAILACAIVPLVGAAQEKPPARAAIKTEDLETVFRIVELGEEKSLKWSGLQTTEVKIPLSIVNDGKKALSAVVTATQFQGGAAPAAVQLNGKASPLPIELGVAKSVVVTLSATLPAAATYQSMVEIAAAGVKPLRFAVEMERKREDLPIEVRDLAAQRTEVAPWSSLTLSPVDFATSVTAVGDPVSVEKPFLQGVTYAAKADGTVKSAALDVTLTGDAPGTVTTRVVPDNAKNLKFTLAGITKAGRYDATVRLTGTGYKPRDVAVTVYAREPGWLAVLLIGFGLLVSIGLRTFANFTRPRQQNEQRAATLFAELEQAGMAASGDEMSVGLVQQLRRDLTDFWNDLVAKGKVTDLAALDVNDLKVRLLPSWIALRKRVKTLKPAAVQKKFNDLLDTARGGLLNRAATSDNINAQVAVLDAMPVAIDRELESALSEQVTKLREDVERDPRPGAQAIAAEMKAIETTDHADLPSALDRIDGLQRQYYVFCATELSRRITSTPPTGVLPGEWSGTTTLVGMAIARTRAARTGSEAGEEFRTAWRLFLETTAGGLTSEVVRRIDLSKAHKEAYKALKDRLDAVLETISAGDLHKASKDLDTVIADFERILRSGGALGGDEDAALIALTGLAGEPAASSSDVVEMFRGGASAEALQRPDAMRMLGVSAAVSLKLFVVAIIVLAIVTGFKTLWLDDWVWGGWSSYLAAFLWGVAFDQFSQAGLTALIRR